MLHWLDSSVGVDALEKGRSASVPLNSELEPVMATGVATHTWHAYDFCPTRLNACDDPTRSRPLRPPTPSAHRDCENLRSNVTDIVAAWLRLPRQARACSNWALIFVLLRGVAADTLGGLAPIAFWDRCGDGLAPLVPRHSTAAWDTLQDFFFHRFVWYRTDRKFVSAPGHRPFSITLPRSHWSLAPVRATIDELTLGRAWTHTKGTGSTPTPRVAI
jgi:hypothetical protein